jgi:hypothetical protein
MAIAAMVEARDQLVPPSTVARTVVVSDGTESVDWGVGEGSAPLPSPPLV